MIVEIWIQNKHSEQGVKAIATVTGLLDSMLGLESRLFAVPNGIVPVVSILFWILSVTFIFLICAVPQLQERVCFGKILVPVVVMLLAFHWFKVGNQFDSHSRDSLHIFSVTWSVVAQFPFRLLLLDCFRAFQWMPIRCACWAWVVNSSLTEDEALFWITTPPDLFFISKQ